MRACLHESLSSESGYISRQGAKLAKLGKLNPISEFSVYLGVLCAFVAR